MEAIKKWNPVVLAPPEKSNNHPMNLPHPFRAFLLGPPGTGKTNMAINLLKHQRPFTKLYWFGNNLDNTTIAPFIQLCKKLEEENPDLEFHFTSDMDEIPTTEEMSRTPDEHKVVIFDDFADLDKKFVLKVSTYSSQARGANCSVMFLSHYYTGTGDLIKKIRSNCSWLVLFRNLPKHKLDLIRTQYLDERFNPKIFLKFYRQATKESGDVIVIDLYTTSDDLRVRAGPDKPMGKRLINDSLRFEE